MVEKNRIIDFNTDAIANENNSHPFIKSKTSFINPVFVYNQPEKETKYLVDPLDLGFDIGNTNTNDFNYLLGFPPGGLNTKDNFADILASGGVDPLDFGFGDGHINIGSDFGLLDLYTNPFNPLGSGGTDPDWNSDLVVAVGATTMQITGVVYDTYGETLPEASVSWSNPLIKQAGVTTDFNGRFNAEVPTDAEITISYVGLKPITFKANNVPSKIVLQENGQLDEIVIYAKNNKKPLMYVGIGLAVVIAGGLLMRKSKQSTKKGKGLKGATPVTL